MTANKRVSIVQCCPHLDAMKNLPSKAELLARIKVAAYAVRLLNTGRHTSPFGPTTKAERVPHSLKRRRAWLLGRTVYPKRVQKISDDTLVLKPGSNQWKIGGRIRKGKGKWRGFPVYVLTLEERATCPKTCHHWRSCYGNKMRWAHRMPHGKELERRLEQEVAGLADAHRRGFAVRLHELGDFYSVEYVELWRQLLERHPALHIWGYTARWDEPIAVALVALTQQHPDRFAMRFSNAPTRFAVPTTISVEHKFQVPNDAILCPEQEGKTRNCSTCAFCWHSKKRIAFMQH